MLRFAVFCALAAFVLTQFGGFIVDTIHGFRVEYDDRNDIVIMTNNTDCFIVEATDATWDAIVRNEDDLHKASEALYAQIRAGTGITNLTRAQETAYHSQIERYQCRRKDAYAIKFTPSSS